MENVIVTAAVIVGSAMLFHVCRTSLLSVATELERIEEGRLLSMKMEFFFLASFPPKGCKVRLKPEIGAVQAKNGGEALKIAAVRYPQRPGWTFELIETIDHDEENQVLEEEHNWRYRRDLVNRLLDQNFQCVN